MTDKIICSGNSNHEKAYVCGNATNEIIPNGLIAKAEFKIKDKEKQILAITQDLSDCLEYDIEDSSVVDTYDTAFKLVNKGWVKLAEDSVVLSKEEMEKLSSSHDIVFCDNKDCSDNLLCRCCEISECPKNIPEYNEKLSANKYKLDLFQKLCKERERANGWEDKYELLEKELKQERRETVEKLIAKIKQFLSNVETVWDDDKYSLYPDVGYKCSEVDDFLDKLEEEEVNL